MVFVAVEFLKVTILLLSLLTTVFAVGALWAIMLMVVRDAITGFRRGETNLNGTGPCMKV